MVTLEEALETAAYYEVWKDELAAREVFVDAAEASVRLAAELTRPHRVLLRMLEEGKLEWCEFGRTENGWFADAEDDKNCGPCQGETLDKAAQGVLDSLEVTSR